MGEVNVDRLRELSRHLRHACRQLHDLGDQGEEAFLGEAKTVNSAKYLLIVDTEAALDICNHLAVKKGGRSPEDYADCMTIRILSNPSHTREEEGTQERDGAALTEESL